jgi:hypothetical protein
MENEKAKVQLVYVVLINQFKMKHCSTYNLEVQSISQLH